MSTTQGPSRQEPATGNDQTKPPATQQVADKIKQEGERLASKAKQSAEQEAEKRKDVAAEYLKDVSAAIRRGSDELSDHGRDQAASLVSRAAEELDGVASSLSRRKPGELLQEAEKAARQHPTLFYGAAVLAGFAAVRFLKSSQAGGQRGGGSSPAGHGSHASEHSHSGDR